MMMTHQFPERPICHFGYSLLISSSDPSRIAVTFIEIDLGFIVSSKVSPRMRAPDNLQLVPSKLDDLDQLLRDFLAPGKVGDEVEPSPFERLSRSATLRLELVEGELAHAQHLFGKETARPCRGGGSH
jgi:hypothetical protein